MGRQLWSRNPLLSATGGHAGVCPSARNPGFQAHIEAFHGPVATGGLAAFSPSPFARPVPPQRRLPGGPAVTPGPAGGGRTTSTGPAAQLCSRLSRPLQASVIFLRRTDGQGRTECLGHRWLVDPLWPHRLVRLEVDLTTSRIRIYKLRRREPDWQPCQDSAIPVYPAPDSSNNSIIPSAIFFVPGWNAIAVTWPLTY